MLENFIKSLGFLGVNATNTNHKPDDKFIFIFEDETINRYWRCFYAFYKLGRKEILDELMADLVKKVNS